MRIYNYKSNQTIVESKHWRALLSYDVPQIVVINPRTPGLNPYDRPLVLVTNKKYSNTTSKHRNAYVNSLRDGTRTIIDATPERIQEITGLETR